MLSEINNSKPPPKTQEIQRGKGREREGEVNEREGGRERKSFI